MNKRIKIAPEIRFWSRVNKNGPLIEKMESSCWEYMPPRGYTNQRGASFNWGSNEYGVKCTEVGRASWILSHGKPFPKGMSARRRCSNYRCVRPEHLFVGKRTNTFSPTIVDEDGNHWKKCNGCKELLLFNDENFGYGGWKGSLASRCRPCTVKQSKNSQAKHWYQTALYRSKQMEKEKGIACDLTKEFILDLYDHQGGKCYWLGIPMTPSIIHRYPFHPSLDRLDRNGGYTKDNVVLCCQFVNVGRNSCSYDDFVNAIKQQPKVFGRGLWNDKE